MVMFKLRFVVILLFMTGVCACLPVSPAEAQQTSVVENFRDMAGQPFFPRQYTDVTGSPYLFDDWTPSTITLNDGKIIKNIKTNFNLVTEELLYMEVNDKVMVASPAVIKLVEAGPRKFITTTGNSYFEILSTQGKATLLRHTRKVIMETKPFNSATIQKNFATTESHAILIDGNATEIKSANDIYEALPQGESLKDFAKKEKLKQKSVASWVKIVNYYNTI